MKKSLRNLLLGTVLALNGCADPTLYQTAKEQTTSQICPKEPQEDNTSEEQPTVVYQCQNGERKIEYRTPPCGPLTPGFMVEEREQLCAEGVWGEFSEWYVTMNCQPPTPECPPPPLCLDGQVEIDWRMRENSCGLNGRGSRVEERSMVCTDGAWSSWSPFTPTGDCFDPDRCVDGEVVSIANSCGLNSDGLLTDRCVNGVFEYVSCVDPAECLNGTTLEVPCGITGEGTSTVFCEDGYLNVGTCSVPDIDRVDCIEDKTQSRVLNCGGYNGQAKQFQERTKECVDYHFAAWSSWTDLTDCIDPDDCVNGSTRTDATAYCGINGTGFVEQMCEVGAWVNSRCDDDTVCRNTEIVAYQVQDISCGINNRGIQFQSREQLCVDGQPGEWSTWVNVESCLDNDECLDGTTIQQTLPNFCGINWRGNLTVEYACREGVYDTDYVRRIRCDDSDVCKDGSLVDYDLQSVACGVEGIQFQEKTQDCVSGRPGTWSSWTNVGSCIVPEVCPEGENTNVPCGINGRGIVAVSCEEGTPVYESCVDTEVCRDGEIRDTDIYDTSCGLNGRGIVVQESIETCVVGYWSSPSLPENRTACFDTDECGDGERRAAVGVCGINNNGVLEQTCIEGVWVDGACMDDEVCLNDETISVACGYNGNGIASASCTDGRLTVGLCDDPDPCRLGDTRRMAEACGLNGRGILEELCADVYHEDGTHTIMWRTLGCTDTDVCVDGTIDISCCGYEGEGTKSRTCIVGSGIWGEDGGCSMENLINVSNSLAQNTNPKIDGNDIVFKENSAVVMYLDLTERGLVIPERINSRITSPNGGDALSPGDWSISNCEDLDIREKQVVFECKWVDRDWFFDDYSDGHVYLVEKTETESLERKHLWGYYPSVSSTQFSFREGANIKVYDNTTGTLVRDFGTSRGFPDIDEDYVVFEKDDAGKTRVYLGNITTGATQLISGIGTTHSGYTPSIDGNDVVFYSDRDGNKQLYHYDTGSATLERITNCNNNYEPSVSQGKVAFTSERDGLPNKEVYICDLTETSDCCADAVNISSSPSADYSPSISGCKVAFTSERDGNKEIYVYDLCEGGCDDDE